MDDHSDPGNTLARDINRLKGIIDGVFQTVDYKGDRIPLFAHLELSLVDMCNRACVFCPRSNPDIAPNQNLLMDLGLCERMAAELKSIGFAGTVSLAGYGEPLMHRQVADIVKIFASVANVEIYTNGDLLNPGRIRTLMEAGTGTLIINMYDGPDQLPHFRAMLDEAGVDPARFLIRDRYHGPELGFGMKLTNRAGTVNVGTMPEVNQSLHCYYSHYYLVVDWNGDVCICPHDWNRRIRAGNASAQSLVEIWGAATMDRYRKRLGEGRRDMAPCQKCNVEGTLFGRRHFEAWAEHYRAKA